MYSKWQILKAKAQAIFLDHSVVKLEISDKIKAISNPNYSWNEEENKENDSQSRSVSCIENKMWSTAKKCEEKYSYKYIS